MARPPLARSKVLHAAERVLREHGAVAFTLDAVATRAGVSKGGLMYHFPTKEALLAAMVDRAVAAVDTALAAAAADNAPGAFTKAYLDITVPDPAAEDKTPERDSAADQTVDDRGVVAALAVAIALDPSLLTPLRQGYLRWQARLEADGLDPAAATLVRLAVDGWWLAALLDLPPLAPDLHQRTRRLLQQLAYARPDPPTTCATVETVNGRHHVPARNERTTDLPAQGTAG